MVGVSMLSRIYPISTRWSSGETMIKRNPRHLPAVKSNKLGRVNLSISCTLRASPPSLETPSLPFSSDSIADNAAASKGSSTVRKGWAEFGVRDQRLISQLETLEVSASDRSEVHSSLCTQCDNWNLLFHTGVALASVSTAAVGAMNTAEHALGLSMLACLLGIAVAALMALMNKFQPSQLAEEHRHAARFFKRLTTDVQAALETDAGLLERASLLWKQNVGIFHALDSQFPARLGPLGLPRFPDSIHPSILSATKVDIVTPEVRIDSREVINGWTTTTEKALKRTSQLLQNSDVPTAIDQATQVSQLNKVLATTSPLLALSGVICNMVCWAFPGTMCVSGLGAALTVGAFFVHSVSHVLQLGAAYETYRNCAGYYAEIERSIEQTLRVPVHERENGLLFLEKVWLQLGRQPGSPIGANQTKAGTLF